MDTVIRVARLPKIIFSFLFSESTNQSIPKFLEFHRVQAPFRVVEREVWLSQNKLLYCRGFKLSSPAILISEEGYCWFIALITSLRKIPQIHIQSCLRLRRSSLRSSHPSLLHSYYITVRKYTTKFIMEYVPIKQPVF